MGVEPFTMIGMGLSAASSVTGAVGAAQGQQQAAQNAKNAAAAAKTAADQTDTQLLEELRSTIGNIDAIRSAAGTDPFAPTALAVKDEERRVSGRERRIKMANSRIQANALEEEASLRMSAARMSLIGGGLGAGMSLFSGGRSYSPTRATP